MHLRLLRPHARPLIQEAEAVLVERYRDLVRLAHLTLPAALGHHRRVLLAHSLVQRALPRARTKPGVPSVPHPREEVPSRQTAERRLIVEVLRAALAYERRSRCWSPRFALPAAFKTRLPLVIGLRLFPRSGGADELDFARRLSEVPAASRAACLLRSVHGLSEAAVHDLLEAAGVEDPAAAMRTADSLAAAQLAPTAALLSSQEFDACVLQAGPTDLLRRGRRIRLSLGAAAIGLAAATAVVVTAAGDTVRVPSAQARADHTAFSPAELVRTPAQAWDDTSRVDFTAWPPRGSRSHDDGLLGRALTTWAHPPAGTRVRLAPATTAAAPTTRPQLLYAGDVADRAVVLLYDGTRLARYSESRSSARTAELRVARTDDADLTTAAAVSLYSGKGSARYLLAPWISEVSIRDLLRPDVLARPLRTARDGVTRPVSVVSAGRGCESRPVLQLRSSARIVEKHSFLLADRGALSPAHLTYTPLPGKGGPPGRPREATGPAALLAWAHTACTLDSPGNAGVRSVNAWDFAEQSLPDRGGTAVWSCARADTWSGPGDVTVTLRTSRDVPAEPARTIARARSTAACSRFGQNVAATVGWRSPAGHWYVLAAGSRAVTRLSVSGDVSATKQGRTLDLPVSRRPRTQVRATVATGEQLHAFGSR
ncbi:hypothetical protein [Streptomyces sp. NPDC057616]|uniref:hypothetical protein n=1 Tax=Streptomyces sp. NPDC057616 TaxID=3346183 RepID=UPI0036BC399B